MIEAETINEIINNSVDDRITDLVVAKTKIQQLDIRGDLP